MDEFFLQFLWRFQKFQTRPLLLENGEELTVFSPGHQNTHAGPDFLEARIKIGSISWSGSVEVHYRSSDWYRHDHHTDEAYSNVILHVVWIDDQEILLNYQQLPTLVLRNHAEPHLEQAYRNYICQPGPLLCANQLPKMAQIHVNALLDRASASRLQEKSKTILETLQETHGDWEETSYRILAKNFGFKVNSDPFGRLARSIPHQILRKHGSGELSIYALIFGMAGFLNTSDPEDAYHQQLCEEFIYLQKLHQLTPSVDRFHWKFARMRPANFPTVRLAQFAALIHHAPRLFSRMMDISDVTSAALLIRHPLAQYWQSHYDFGKPASQTMRMGQNTVTNVIINSVAPLLAAYSKYTDQVQLLEKACALLEALPPENNHIIRIWKEHEIHPQNASDTQALLFQYHNYCLPKKCLQCNIGMKILNFPA